MKKLSLSLLAAAAALLPACSSEDLASNAPNDGTVTFTLTAPQSIQSRAIAQGDAANDLRVVVFDENGKYLFTDNSKEGAWNYSAPGSRG